MFVRDFIHVARPFQSVAPRFLRDPSWLAPIVDEAVGEAARVSRALGGAPEAAGDAIASTTPVAGVHLDRGAVRSRARGIVVPIAWTNVVEHTWFPSINGDLEVAPFGLSRSELVLSASYQSPEVLDGLADGPVDDPSPESAAIHPAAIHPAAIHPAVVHRVVETGVRAFLQNLAAALETGQTEDPRL